MQPCCTYFTDVLAQSVHAAYVLCGDGGFPQASGLGEPDVLQYDTASQRCGNELTPISIQDFSVVLRFLGLS